MNSIQRISLHGGHSGEFCNHAKDRLEDIVQQYIRLGFPWVGITEHIPPDRDEHRYPDEIKAGVTISDLHLRFARYFATLRELQIRYADEITIFAGFETEAWSGYIPQVKQLAQTYQPDYMVGSVHHVRDICFDYSAEAYGAAAAACGSVDRLYLAYFDLQYEMIRALKPFVVGHFDLIRIFDEQYRDRLSKPDIAGKIDRNLDLIKELGLVMDFNLRPLARGESEPYLTRTILEKIRQRRIPVVPGDDSHGVAQAGGHVDTAVRMLTEMGFDTNWPLPRKKETQ